MFWGLIMESGKRYTQTVERAFHVSMACLEPNTADNETVSVLLGFENREFILCNLNKHKAIQSQLDLNFQSGDVIAFLSSGKGRVHLTGYLLETDDDDEMDEDDDDEEEEMDNDVMKIKSGNDSLTDSLKKSNAIKGSTKRKNEPPVKKPDSKKVKLEAETTGNESSDDEDDDDDESSLEEDSDDLLGGIDEEDDEEDDDDDDDDEDESDEDESFEINALERSKSEDSNKKKKKKENKLNKSNELQQNKNKSPNEKQKNKSLIENQQKNKTPNEKQQQQQQQKNKTPNAKQGGNTPHQQKTPGNQINGIQQQQQSGKKNKNKQGMDSPKVPKTPGAQTPGKKVLEGGVVVEDLKTGNGPVAKPGRQVSVYYVGRLKNNNKQFDSTTEGPGFKFRLGRGEVIKGWDIGLNGMKVGGKRKVTCPAALAYGNKGSPPAIPPNSTLVFDVELRAVN